jgi:PRC-barrel domain
MSNNRLCAALLAFAVVASAAAHADETPQERMQRRFPQPVRVGDLIDLPVYDDNESTLGHVQQVVRTPAGRIELIVSYSPWFGWWGHPVAVPIELVGIFGRQIAALDMSRQEFAKAPTWSSVDAQPIGAEETIKMALARH